MHHAIAECAEFEESKRSYMMQNGGTTGYKVFGKAYKEDLYATAKMFGDWMKEEHPEVKKVRYVRVEHLREFLQTKTGCSPEYVNKLISHFRKIEKCCTKIYGNCIYMRTKSLSLPAMEPTEKTRDYVATEYDFSRLIGVMTRPGTRSEAWKGLIWSHDAGCRVNEDSRIKFGRLTPTGGRWGCGTVTIQGAEDGAKGGRWRVVDILTPEARDRLQRACEGLKPGDYIIRSSRNPSLPIDRDSLSRALSRAVKSTPDIANHWKKGNGFHSFRKTFAQASYDAARGSGCSKKEAKDYASCQLGHGEDRDDVIRRYVENVW